MNAIILSGMGVVCALGNRVDEAVKRAWRGESGFARCDEALGPHGRELSCRVAAPVRDFDMQRWVPERAAGWTDRATGFALAAAHEAIEQAGLTDSGVKKDRVGVIIATAAPGSTLYQQAFEVALGAPGPTGLPGRMLPQLSAHIAASMLAMQHGFTGPTFAVVDACASGATAMALASDLLAADRADAVVVVGTDAPIGLTIFGSMLAARAMHATADPVRACRPFSPDRAGLIAGEGAGAVVLERASVAAARGVRASTALLGAAQTNDAYHVYRPEPSGSSWANAMTLALERARRNPAEVDYVSAHAASTPLGDLAETRAIRIALGARASHVAVSATKSMHGHTFGAAGAIETVLAVAAMERGWVLPTANFAGTDPECDLDYVPDSGRQARCGLLLKNSFGFGGTNTCLVLGQV